MDPLSGLLQTQPPEHVNFTTESTGESLARERGSITFFTMPLLITFVVLGFIGNLIIVHAVCIVPRFNRAENLMLANLSVTSVATMISAMSAYIQTTYPLTFYGSLYCKFYAGVHTFMVPAEGFTMMCISLERKQGVRFPLTRATKASVIKKIGIVWFLALLLDLPRGFLLYEYDPSIESLLKCRNTKHIFGTWFLYAIYTTTHYAVTFLLPSFWLTGDWMRLVSQLRFLVACQTLPLHSEYRKRQKKLVRHAIIFTSIFIAVKVPVGTHFFLYQLPPELLSESVIEWSKAWKRYFFSVQIIHGCFYPFIIFCLSGDIRKYLSCCVRDRRHRPVPRFQIS